VAAGTGWGKEELGDNPQQIQGRGGTAS